MCAHASAHPDTHTPHTQTHIHACTHTHPQTHTHSFIPTKTTGIVGWKRLFMESNAQLDNFNHNSPKDDLLKSHYSDLSMLIFRP